MNNPILIYCMCKNKNEAKTIGNKLLEKKLVACVNIIDNATSLYCWPPEKRELCTDQETVLIAKTFEEKWDAIEQEIINLHSYSTPLILALSIKHISNKYAEWMKGELS